MNKHTAGLGITAAVAAVFYLADVPTWAWAFPAAMLVINVGINIRERAIEAHR